MDRRPARRGLFPSPLTLTRGRPAATSPPRPTAVPASSRAPCPFPCRTDPVLTGLVTRAASRAGAMWSALRGCRRLHPIHGPAARHPALSGTRRRGHVGPARSAPGGKRDLLLPHQQMDGDTKVLSLASRQRRRQATPRADSRFRRSQLARAPDGRARTSARSTRLPGSARGERHGVQRSPAAHRPQPSSGTATAATYVEHAGGRAGGVRPDRASSAASTGPPSSDPATARSASGPVDDAASPQLAEAAGNCCSVGRRGSGARVAEEGARRALVRCAWRAGGRAAARQGHVRRRRPRARTTASTVFGTAWGLQLVDVSRNQGRCAGRCTWPPTGCSCRRAASALVRGGRAG